MRRLAFLALVVIAGMLACGERSLVAIDVSGDQKFTDVRLTIMADGSVMKEFPHATFDQTNVYRIGVYMPADVSGVVSLEGTADDGTCVKGRGTAQATGVQGGEITKTVSLVL